MNVFEAVKQSVTTRFYQGIVYYAKSIDKIEYVCYFIPRNKVGIR